MSGDRHLLNCHGQAAESPLVDAAETTLADLPAKSYTVARNGRDPEGRRRSWLFGEDISDSQLVRVVGEHLLVEFDYCFLLHDVRNILTLVHGFVFIVQFV